MAIRMQQRRGTASQWTTANPTLSAGEIGFETDTGKFKMGNGSSTWTQLSYFTDASDFDTTAIESTIDSKVSTAINNLLDGAPAALDTLNEIADAIDNDSSFASTIVASIGQMAPLSNFNGHLNSTTNVHGITDTSLLATKSYADTAASDAASGSVSTHNADTTGVHGITDTSLLATKSYADTAADGAAISTVGTHNSTTLNVHGISDTSVLVTTTALSTGITAHNEDTTGVHGIADTSLLETTSGAQTKATTAQTAAQSFATSAVGTHNSAITNVHGITNTANLVYTSDSRLSDTRTPTDDSVTTDKISDSAVTSAKIANNTIVNADINASAAIDWTKLAISSTVSSTELGYVDGVTSAIQTQLDSKLATSVASSTYAPLASPALTGTPTAPTATAGTNTTQVATTGFVSTAIANLVASAPATLDTLNELATALGNDASFSTTITNNLAAKAPINSPTFTGTVTLPAAGIVFSDGTQSKEGVPSRTPIIQKSAAYTLSALSERDSMIEVSHTGGTAVDITIPANSSVAYPVGTSIDVLRTNTGGVRIVGAAGVTVNGTPGTYLRAQWSVATLFKRATDTWVLIGDLATA